MHAAATNDGVLEIRNAGLFLLEQQFSLTYILFFQTTPAKKESYSYVTPFHQNL